MVLCHRDAKKVECLCKLVLKHECLSLIGGDTMLVPPFIGTRIGSVHDSV